jgi:hypothetical protein
MASQQNTDSQGKSTNVTVAGSVIHANPANLSPAQPGTGVKISQGTSGTGQKSVAGTIPNALGELSGPVFQNPA